MRFIAMDVETANADMASICSVGLASFENGALVEEWYSLIDPSDHFSSINVSIHGITQADVRGAPTFNTAMREIERRLDDQIVVTHTHFDRVALHQAAMRWSGHVPRCEWLDCARVARRTWAECARSGYGLAAVCERIGYAFNHHNALEDAKASGHVLLAAMRDSGLNLGAVMKRVQEPISGSGSRGTIKRD